MHIICNSSKNYTILTDFIICQHIILYAHRNNENMKKVEAYLIYFKELIYEKKCDIKRISRAKLNRLLPKRSLFHNSK